MANNVSKGEAWLVYDGECPFCSAYISCLRVRDSTGILHLVNARDGGAIVEEIRQANIDLDEGMVLKFDNRFYHGADCVHVLACLSGPSTWFNRINAVIFRSHSLSFFLYPILRLGRNVVLRILGHRKIGSCNLRGKGCVVG
jgi:predicted DCC family thiol-disulfide oxidoreductase YuxK